MSRGFVKEDDQEEAPMIPPRAALPPDVTNYVTPNGMQQLQNEKEALRQEITDLDTEDERERRRDLAVLNGKLSLLQERISSARVLDPKEQVQDEVRFGATVAYLFSPSKKQFEFSIVGVDEADVNKKKIAFVAPIAKALTGSKVGETVKFEMGSEVRNILIVNISY